MSGEKHQRVKPATAEEHKLLMEKIFVWVMWRFLGACIDMEGLPEDKSQIEDYKTKLESYNTGWKSITLDSGSLWTVDYYQSVDHLLPASGLVSVDIMWIIFLPGKHKSNNTFEIARKQLHFLGVISPKHH